MRPSRALITLALLMTAATAIVGLWLRAGTMPLLLVWLALIVLTLLDLFTSTPRSRLRVDARLPEQGYAGQAIRLDIDIAVQKGKLPHGLEARLDMASALTMEGDGWVLVAAAANPNTASISDSATTSNSTSTKAKIETATDDKTRRLRAALRLTRRGRYSVHALWLSWRSRFGLIEIFTRVPLNRDVAVLPDISPILSGAINAQILPLISGQKDMKLRGDGSEFHQLRDFVPGMDTRGIDWKRSARVRELLVRETRAERNHQVILCMDSGRLMTERLAGLPKLDRAINAALAVCWATGAAGDLVGLYSFDSRPRLYIPPLPGRAAFPRLRAISADLRYATQETNHTLGMTHLSSLLKRRSLIIVFSDFVDSITAELMIENIQALAKRHFIVYVALRDPALSALAAPKEVGLDAIALAVASRQILQERQTVLEKLRRLGVMCLDCTPQTLTADLVSRYVEIKSREML